MDTYNHKQLFQSTLPQGERPSASFAPCTIPPFQSTLPQGERRLCETRRGYDVHFNPRSHKGSDQVTGDSLDKAVISIHAPTRGATKAYMKCRTGQIFQSTLPQGERLLRCGYRGYTEDFNPRSHKGSDWFQTPKRWIDPLFQSTLPQGERQS